MQLSIIILNYNVRYFVEACILSVQEAIENFDAEIIVIDNNSSDDSCEMIKTRFPEIKLIENNQNEGFSKGNNKAVKEAKGEYVCILNPDTIIAEDTFSKIFEYIDKNKNNIEIGIIGCKLIDGAGNFLPESKRGIPTPWVAFTKVFGLYKIVPKSSIFNQYYAQHISENQTGKVPILVGAFMLMQRQLYNQIGGFDENCFMYSDDIDLSYMVLKTLKSNIYFSETTAIHYKGESTTKDGVYMKRFQNAMNFFYKKHFGTSVFFSFFMKTGIVAFSFIKMFQGKSKSKLQPDHYILISNNYELQAVLEKKIQKNISILNIKNRKVVFSQSISHIGTTEYIIDLNCITFKDAISFLQNNKNKNTTYKILPPKSKFLIGSNSSNDRGEVVLF